MRGIIAAAAYVPHWRLNRADVAQVFGKGGGRGHRAVASFDEDSTSMAVEAARLAGRGLTSREVDDLWFATASPAYLEKTNACAVHAALELPAHVGAMDLAGLRAGAAALRTALNGRGSTMITAADVRTGLPTSSDESRGGDGAAAVVVGDDGSVGEVVAEPLAFATVTDELTDRWRIPGAIRGRAWEERFAEPLYRESALRAWDEALGATGTSIDHLIVTGPHERATATVTKALRPKVGNVLDTFVDSIGHTGTPHPLLALAAALDVANPDETIALVTLMDGAEVVMLRARAGVDGRRKQVSKVADQIEQGRNVSYGRYLSWRGLVTVEPPNRPSPPRTSSSAAYRAKDWKFGLVGSRDRSSGMVHLPPARVSERGGALDDMDDVRIADRFGTIVSFTVDRLVYSPSPPVVFAIVDFDGGGRVPLEVADVDPAELSIGDRVVPTFRRLHTEDDIHNYFWKVRPARGAEVS